ncbi:pyrroline-5-carboxylate reductase [Tepidibacillus sp. LV47]|uniref:pyrroline-5-carboxylate reductase n=1 Tax=Tepidibacillus sp. LV47 TaxID=3398228 RepID=UPI003AAA4806
MEKNICFLGAGSIAEAMIAGLTKKQILDPSYISVINRSDKQKIERLIKKYGVKQPVNKYQAISSADILILAVKPKDIWEVLQEIYPYSHSDQLILSVIAGVTTDLITEAIHHNGPVIRAMPNTSAMVGLSATAIALGKYAKKQHSEIAQSILQAIGTVTVVKEKLLDAVTGLSGSGPAYLYYLVEAMENSAVELGIDHKTARELIIQTIIGAGYMLKETMEEPMILREKVTSPGGSTMAGLEVLKEFQFQKAIDQAIKKAALRSQELGKLIMKIQ